MKTAKVLVIGLGNPILGDDGVGWQVGERLRNLVHDPRISIECLALGGLRLMEAMEGYDFAVIVDSITPPEEQSVGQVMTFPLEALPDLATGHMTSSHDTSLQKALDVGRRLGLHLPTTVMVVGITARNVYEFAEGLTPPVAAALPQAEGVVLKLLADFLGQC